MKKSSQQLAILLFLFFFIQACAPVYVPTAPVVFTNEQQGDVSIAVRQGPVSSSAQCGYAISDKINVGLSASFSYMSGSVNGQPLDTAIMHEVMFIAGYFNKFSEKHLLEINAGAGVLRITRPTYRGAYYKGYIQPTFTFLMPNNNSKFSLLTRVIRATYTDYKNGFGTVYNLGFVEPCLDLSIGKKLQLKGQIGASFPLLNMGQLEYSPFIANLGLGYSFSSYRSSSKATLPSASF